MDRSVPCELGWTGAGDSIAFQAPYQEFGLSLVAYARRHLTEIDLTPLRIARAYHISLRHLYTLCRAGDIRIAEWIFEQRLAGAKLELQDPRLLSRTIELTARRWGFVDPTHFGRRFRSAYGVSPREFKRLSAA